MTISTPKTPTQVKGPRAMVGAKKRLYNVVQAVFRTSFVKYYFDARELQLAPGDQVIVRTERGPVIAKITGQIQRRMLPPNSISQVLRKATETDISQADKNETHERDAYRFCIERIRGRKLPMKLIRVQYMQDGSKIVFYFSADGRVDFRDLVKDLAHQFRTRIEMHQIGVRDGARMLGGIGPCGRELCCSTFLDNFAPVSIRMAKHQGLTLNPTKVSGMCGRLMCCLVYEQQIYRRMRKSLPRAGQRVRTELGEGEILGLDVINRKVTVRLDDQNRETFRVDDIEIIDAHKREETVDSARGEDASHGADKYRFQEAEPARARVEFVGMTDLAADGGEKTDEDATSSGKSRRRRAKRRSRSSKNSKNSKK
ncbi:PSP1 domain-containing protein [Bradymonas sediminis]|nr:stage 0 sporulation family protein [Bradymonas sediminis]TDP61781.1 cell fate regulator YaaT (PSP1 superfamily) [Bradymonas sediminis]